MGPIKAVSRLENVGEDGGAPDLSGTISIATLLL